MSTKLAYSLRVFAKDADILDAFHTGCSCAGDGLVVDHILLKPQIRDAETDYVFDDGRNVFRRAKYVDEINAFGIILFRGSMRRLEIGIALQAQHFS
jgi:hypothetical protein